MSITDSDIVSVEKGADQPNAGEKARMTLLGLRTWIAANISVGGGDNSSLQQISQAHRYYLYADARWVTSSDDNHGSSAENATESGATGVDPLIEFEHQGLYLRKGTIIKQAHVTARLNNTAEISDLEYYLYVRHPDPITRWVTGMDSDAEDLVTDLWRGQFWSDISGNGPLLGARNDFTRRIMNFNDFVMPEDGYVSNFVKPTRLSGTTTRYLYSQLSLLIDNKNVT